LSLSPTIFFLVSQSLIIRIISFLNKKNHFYLSSFSLLSCYICRKGSFFQVELIFFRKNEKSPDIQKTIHVFLPKKYFELNLDVNSSLRFIHHLATFQFLTEKFDFVETKLKKILLTILKRKR
jgi:hypothetical protein